MGTFVSVVAPTDEFWFTYRSKELKGKDLLLALREKYTNFIFWWLILIAGITILLSLTFSTFKKVGIITSNSKKDLYFLSAENF